MEDDPGGDEVNDFDSKFVDEETNFQHKEPKNYCLMYVTRDLREAVTNQLMAQDLDLISGILKILFLILLMRSIMNLMNFFALGKRLKNSTRNLKFLKENQRIPFIFPYFLQFIII